MNGAPSPNKLTSLSNLGGLPKCKIQFNLAPTNTIKSAFPRARLLAALTQFLCSSLINPFPIGVGRKGKLLFSTSFETFVKPPPKLYAAPFPIMIKGLLACFIKLLATSTR